MSNVVDFLIEWTSFYTLKFKDSSGDGYSVTVTMLREKGRNSVAVSIAQSVFDVYEEFDSIERARMFLREFSKPFDLVLDPSSKYDFLNDEVYD